MGGPTGGHWNIQVERAGDVRIDPPALARTDRRRPGGEVRTVAEVAGQSAGPSDGGIPDHRRSKGRDRGQDHLGLSVPRSDRGQTPTAISRRAGPRSRPGSSTRVDRGSAGRSSSPWNGSRSPIRSPAISSLDRFEPTEPVVELEWRRRESNPQPRGCKPQARVQLKLFIRNELSIGSRCRVVSSVSQNPLAIEGFGRVLVRRTETHEDQQVSPLPSSFPFSMSAFRDPTKDRLDRK